MKWTRQYHQILQDGSIGMFEEVVTKRGFEDGFLEELIDEIQWKE